MQRELETEIKEAMSERENSMEKKARHKQGATTKGLPSDPLLRRRDRTFFWLLAKDKARKGLLEALATRAIRHACGIRER